MSTADWTLIDSALPLDNPGARPLAPAVVEPLASDLFTGSNAADINGRVLDAGWGGAADLQWVANVANAIAVAGGAMVKGAEAGSGRATIAVANEDVEAGFTILAGPADGSSVYLDVRGNLAAGASGTRNGYRLQLTRTGGVLRVQLVRRSGTNTTLGASHAVQLGDRVSIRAIGSTLTLFVNDYDVEEISDAAHPSGGFVGFEPGTGSTFALTKFFVERVITD
ncbi:hypothetical protein [Microbacterium dauci]|uniref:3-keto-disaccharide hydrolase domain-containing protein n=1 Tax=Microbacterium dauci TaxID=3048008 RepID=A0ABT6ZC80_9MICO|nr:hypothetical protein [Microbacterium sp. LX3-4]MDJ1113252.1 hypothetical protein [Microbacterium sp. LX3-4]